MATELRSTRGRRALVDAFARTSRALMAGAAIATANAQGPTVRPLPERLTDAQFWSLVVGASEPSGYFPMDNWTSNEMSAPDAVRQLKAAGVSGGAYLGVGPEQNFTYIAAVRPRIAFIVDIRRQMMLQHLMYKAIFELAPDRVAFAELLFARRRGGPADTTSSAQDLMDAFFDVGPTAPAVIEANFNLILNQLARVHRFALDSADVVVIRRCYSQFAIRGARIGYTGNGSFARDQVGVNADRVRTMNRYAGVTYAALMATTGDGKLATSFLATEEAYRFVRELHLRNLFVPVVGDFGGKKAIWSVGEFLREHDTRVSAFYLSNVEDYLFAEPVRRTPSDKWRAFYANASTLPMTPTSVFVRWNLDYGTSVCPMQPFLEAFAKGRIRSSRDALNCRK